MAIPLSGLGPILSRALSPAAPQAGQSARPEAPTAVAADGFVQQSPEGGNKAPASLLGGFLDNFAPPLKLSPEQIDELKQAAPILQRAAGEDGRWGPSDLADNVQAIKGDRKFNPISGIVEKKLRQGFEEMTGKEVPPLTQEQKDAAMERWNSMSAEQKREARLSPAQLTRLGDALKSVQDSTPLTKLGGKVDSLPADFLSKVAEKPTVSGLMEARKGDEAPPQEETKSESASGETSGSEVPQAPETEPSAESEPMVDSEAAPESEPEPESEPSPESEPEPPAAEG